MISEQRIASRAAVSIEVAILNAGRFERSSVLNMSKGGVFIIIDNPQPVDSTQAMQIRLPCDPEIMDIEGRVVWIKQKSSASPAGMGIQFIKMSPRHQEKINFYVESCLQEMRKCDNCKKAAEAALL